MDDKRIRVLIVDDSAFARKVLRQALSSNRAIEVVGIAGDGLEAIERIAELDPDVVTLDLVMPYLDGIGVLRQLEESKSRARVVVITTSDEESEIAVQALQLGAVTLVRKPTALATDRLYELSADVARAVIEAAAATRMSYAPKGITSGSERPSVAPGTGGATKMVVVGTSTGGPHALTRLLTDLPADLPIAMAIALHIPADYTEALARRLDSVSKMEVLEARDGLEIVPGRVVLAKGGMHLGFVRRGEKILARVSSTPEDALYRPSVDELFRSAAQIYGASALGVVLTGMGEDGLVGAKALIEAGGRVINEAERSCVVYGMPRAVREAGLSSGEARIEEMADEVVRKL